MNSLVNTQVLMTDNYRHLLKESDKAIADLVDYADKMLAKYDVEPDIDSTGYDHDEASYQTGLEARQAEEQMISHYQDRTA